MRVADPDGVHLRGELGIVGVVVVLAVVAILVMRGWVLLVMLAALLVGIGGLLVRIVFRRLWLVRARSGGAR